MSDDNDDLWFVQLGEGSVRALTLDQLDDAFQAGTIDESTLVRMDGSAEWKPLGEVLAGGEEPTPASSPSQVIAVHDALPPSAPPPPIVSELGADIDESASFGASRKRAAIFGGVAAVAVLGAVAFTAVRVASSPAATPDNLGAALPTPAAAPPAPIDEAKADAGPRFSDEQRRMLMEADKKREAEAAAKREVRAAKSHGPSKPIKIGDPIKKGGSKYDPLNGAL